MLSHVPASDWILAGFVFACALLPLLAEFGPGRKRDDRDDDTDRDQDDGGPDLLIAA